MTVVSLVVVDVSLVLVAPFLSGCDSVHSIRTRSSFSTECWNASSSASGVGRSSASAADTPIARTAATDQFVFFTLDPHVSHGSCDPFDPPGANSLRMLDYENRDRSRCNRQPLFHEVLRARKVPIVVPCCHGAFDR